MNTDRIHFSNILLWCGLIGLLLGTSACAGSKASSEYSIGFVNKTGQYLDRVVVYFGDKRAAFPGKLVVGGKATEGFIPLQVPPEAEVRWIKNNESHSTKVNLDQIVPKSFTDGIIYFIFNGDDSITVKTATYTDIEARLKIEKQ